MAYESKEDVDIEKLYGHLCKASKETIISEFKVKEKGLSSKEANEKLSNNGYNQITRIKTEKMV